MATSSKQKKTTTIIIPSLVDVVVGIDPDSDKSGVAVIEKLTRKITIDAMKFADVLDCLQYIKRQSEVSNKKFCVIIEAGWLNTSHWHLNNTDTRASAAAKGNSVGRNHETGRKIAEMCEHWNIPYQLVKPLVLRVRGRYLWKGKDGKITHEELQEITQLKNKRSNQEERDALLLAWNWLGLPLFARPKISKKT